MIDLSGEMLGQYELIEPIGKGGMATVYRAIQPSMGRTVAIKVIAPELADEPEFLTRFEREARIIASLQHPNILEVHDFGRQGKLTYLVMRLMSGGNLKEELRAGIMDLDRIVQIVRQIASALDYAHERGIVHRDLKPSNVLLDDDGNVALTDFGIAKMVGGHTLASDLTLAGEVMGTPKYMAPEQWRSEPIDGRADIYALGILTYQMLTGQVPFSAQTPHSLMYQHLDREPPSLHEIRPALPAALDPVIKKALAKDRNQRYQSAGILATELQHALSQPNPLSGDGAPPVTWHTRPSRPVRPQPDEDSPADLVVRDDRPKRPRRSAVPDPLRARSPGHTVHTEAPHDEAQHDAGERDQQTQPFEPSESRPALHPYEAIGAQHYAPPPYRQPAPKPPVDGFASSHTSPYRPPVYESHAPQSRVPKPDEVGIGRLFSVMAAVIISLALFFVIVFVIALVSIREEPDLPPDSNTPAATATFTPIPPAARANAAITYPPDNTRFSLGDVVPIRFTVTDKKPITRVELRRFNQVIAALPANNNTVFSGEFAYPVSTTGLHQLEVVPFTGEIEGNPAVVNLIADAQ
jgi:serine/threonine protein kinase